MRSRALTSGKHSLARGTAGSAPVERRPGLLRRVAGWIQGWHGGQLLTFWAGAAIVPWQISFWREILFRNRLEAFLDPARRLGPGGRIAELVMYVVLPVLVLLVTTVWVRGRLRRTPTLRG